MQAAAPVAAPTAAPAAVSADTTTAASAPAVAKVEKSKGEGKKAGDAKPKAEAKPKADAVVEDEKGGLTYLCMLKFAWISYNVYYYCST